LLLAIALWTAALAGGICLTLAGGQKLYLQQSWLGLSDAAKALAVGLGAGALAGIVGQSFFQFTTVSPASSSSAAFSPGLSWAECSAPAWFRRPEFEMAARLVGRLSRRLRRRSGIHRM